VTYKHPTDPTATDWDVLQWTCEELWGDPDEEARPRPYTTASRIVKYMEAKKMTSLREAAVAMIKEMDEAKALSAAAKLKGSW
jgi:hypothetical protein